MLRMKISPILILEYMLAFLLVLECNSVYQRAVEFDIHLNWMCVFVAFGLVALTMRRVGLKKSILLRIVVFLCFFLIYLLLTFSKSNVMSFVMLFCLLFPAMLVYLQGKSGVGEVLSLYEKFSFIVVWLTLVSTIVWFLAEIAGMLSPNMAIRILWGNDHSVNGVAGLYFQTQLENTFGLRCYRNSSIFCEAPMFNLVVCLALIYELFLKSRINKRRIVVLLLGLLSSMTSTGLMMLGVCFALLYWKQMKTKRKAFKILYVAGMVILIPVGFVLLQSLLETKSVTGSFSIRMADYIVGLHAFLSNPLTGTGFNNLANLLTEQAGILAQFGVRSSATGFSNSIAAVLGQGGISLFACYLFPFFAMFKYGRENSEVNYIAWDISFLILFSVTIFHAKYIMIYFLAFAYMMHFQRRNR